MSVKRLLVMALVLVLNLVLLSTVFQYIRILDVIPNITLALVTAYALLRGSTGGAVLGLCAGLLQDALFGAYVGQSALPMLLLGAFAGRGFKDFYRENYLLPVITTAVCTFLYGFWIYVVTFFFRGNYNPLPYLTGTILPETVYTCVLCPVLYRLMFALNDWLERGEAHQRKLF